MARNVTRSELKRFSANASGSRSFTKSLTASAHNLTFISHSSKDKELVMGAMEIIANHGGVPYIDEVDPAMPKHTSEETADLLKSRITECKRFVLLTSPNSKDSRWVPWELGVADGKKGVNRIAIFAASDNEDDDKWSSWEYMGLYPRIVWGRLQGHPKPLWMVYEEKTNSAVTLRSWLTT
ncbi:MULTISPECIES: toll/interleukin-1 receptor domain-containing protein [Pseudomonas]|uniref:Toll/interleukin-1 receptor domain-containing protein n=1 Tax=Pseudomonas capeferrum TaxID=1495066 RepID=A0ABY7R6S9_9PSED|nr:MULTISPECIES: toll/interleukin-1 receptor domain-containing protein [Pseudomonas]MUT50475.1 TIR domain-containing protein [Pseudomonas sp. TDA1]WCH99265.1 toll/interleukin-1 receptor domain-containing protein [Pseudomonas capeferrum]